MMQELNTQHTIQSDLVQINSTVSIKEAATGKVMQFTVVSPEYAEIRQKKISANSPMGRALIGCRKGQVMSLDLPAGPKSFLILEVHQF